MITQPNRLLYLLTACVGCMLVVAGCSRTPSENNATENTDPGVSNNQEDGCSRGTLDCACDEGSICGLGEDGRQLACVFGVCEEEPCELGSAGCACDAGSCSEGLECSSDSGIERCEVSGCEVGQAGCTCALDRSCAMGSTCVLGVCEVQSCTVGALDCACSRRLSCSAGLSCDLTSGKCVDPGSCTPGNLGCECLSDDTCVGDLTCNGGKCEDPDCPAGLEGCACVDEMCGLDSNGDQLDCNGGVCERTDCPAGSTGCACRFGSDCDTEGDTCVDGYCKSDSCIPGTQGCECLAGSCNPGLQCQDNAICVNNEGKSGGPCKEDNTCDRNLRCDDTVAPAVCVRCDLGTIGCQCQDDGGCNTGLQCVMDHCVGDETVFNRVPADDAKCYTSCTEGLSTETESRDCINGLMEGCIDGASCVEGSCVKDGDSPDICFEDTDCPSFQLCMQGRCYVECERNSDCSDAKSCYQKVCRDTCDVNSPDCESGYVCESDDGGTGYCMLQASTTGINNDVSDGGFELSDNFIEFNNTFISTSVKLTNNSSEYVNFTLRKVEHEALLTSNAKDEVRDYDESSSCTGAQCPLWWLEVGEFGKISADREVVVRAPPNCFDDCPVITIRVANAGQAIDAKRWRGVIEVQSNIGSDRIDLSYVASPQGRWSGTMSYFANFETQGIDTYQNDAGLMITGWLDKSSRDDVSTVKNGLLQRWGAFRNGDLTGGWQEMKAVLTSTNSGQWQFPSVRDACQAQDGACYLFDAGAGAGTKFYVTSLDAAPIPTGVTEFPMALNMHIPDSADPAKLEGRVETELALHYAGTPEISVEFSGDPTTTASCDADVLTNCVTFIDTMDLKLSVGGRYALAPGESSCDAGYVYVEEPWLIPGFLDASFQDAASGLYRRGYCVDERLPNYPYEDDAQRTQNMNLARSNPIPNGRVLDREVELLDGALIDQTDLFIIFRERYPSFIDDEDVVAYGYMLLKRQPVQLDEADDNFNGVADQYEGSSFPDTLLDSDSATSATCSRDILDEVIGAGVQLSSSNAPTAIQMLIDGGQPSASDVLTPSGSNGAEEVHYVCHETGLFDGGPDNTANWGSGELGPNDDSCGSVNGQCEDGRSGSVDDICGVGTDVTDCGMRYTDTRVACPKRSEVTFFTASASVLPNIHNEACQDDGTCMERLNDWINNGSAVLEQVQPMWTCEGDAVFCDENELDRRDGKVFFKAGASNVAFLSMRAEIEDAFRYRTRFRSRDGLSSVGFVPSVCEEFSTTTPYCYNPAKIEQLRERIDCMLYIYDSYYDSANGSQLGQADELYIYLEENFSYREEPSALGGLPTTYDGFERLYAELLIMLGDDAYTDAFESRFDLAGSLAASFEGSKFEEDGIDLSGIAGFEMYKLYQAAQYYDMVLDRFYSMGNVVGAALEAGSPATQRNFISSGTVTSYFDRLIRASTQRSRVMAEIARRYQNFNRPDLARRVAERAYTSTYLESVFLANLITKYYEIAGGSDKPQILLELEQSQLRYRAALVDLAAVYETITSEINFFGYAPDYVPFPALDNTSTQTAESNAFEKVLRTATSKMEIAKAREQNALQQTRTYETDEASFQAELTRITRTYENQLADLCGTFTTSEGIIYPAVAAYAYLDDRLSLIGDPCGFVSEGAIYRSIGELQLAELEIRRLAVQAENIYESIEIEKDRLNQQCDLTLEIADYNYKVGSKLFNLQEEVKSAQETSELIMRGVETAKTALDIVLCEGANCAGVGGALATLAATTLGAEAAIQYNLDKQREAREERSDIELESAAWNTEKQCDSATIASNAQVAQMLLGLKDIEISMLAANYRLTLAMAEISRLRNQAKRLEVEWQETLENTINIEAAKNDPNIRIYRNDAVINADISFEDAIREAYRLTVVYEYYTSTTYANRDQLFLIRMVSSGDYNLENYIYELSNAFVQFEEEYGIPELRVEVLSLRDDILSIPLTGDDGSALTIDERAALLRAKLQDPGLLNSDGYLAVPFNTDLERLSPLTRNHKIFYVEANIEGNDSGDFLGRLYLRTVGTSTIRTIDDEAAYYRFPARTAVINPFFNGTRQLSQSNEIYRSYRLRELPLVNTDWELVINQRDEVVNQDINLNELTDIKLYIFYTDFTVY